MTNSDGGRRAKIPRMRLFYALLGDQRGVALIIVLWIFIFLFVVAFDFSSSVREEATAASRFNEETQGYYLAVAGFQQGVYAFLHQSSPNESQRNQKAADLFDGSWRKEEFGAGAYRFRLIDEAGKININRVDENALRRIFTNLGVEEPQRSILVDSIMDWRDPDNLHRISGAENDYYLSLSRPYTAKNGPLDTVEDLLWIRGMSSALFFGNDGGSGASPGTPVQTVALKEIFTVDSPTDRINLRTASAAVIHALLGIPFEKTRSFVEERNKLSEKTLGDLLPLLGIGAADASRQIFVFTSPSVVSVEAEGRIAESGLARRVKGVVRGGAGAAKGGVQIVRWVDRDFGLYQR
ncbi:MAG TPA: hypothetical protein VFU31_19510 [Candidatus Binatia bacterium]|nr:hypothetical protein [Candidatus Binatia bacterium]